MGTYLRLYSKGVPDENTGIPKVISSLEIALCRFNVRFFTKRLNLYNIWLIINCLHFVK